MSNKLPTIPKKGNLPPAQLPAATSGQLPTVAKATHPVRALKDFAAEADDLAEHHGKLHKARQNIRSVCQTPIIIKNIWTRRARCCVGTTRIFANWRRSLNLI
jgi:hypothetical protein